MTVPTIFYCQHDALDFVTATQLAIKKLEANTDLEEYVGI